MTTEQGTVFDSQFLSVPGHASHHGDILTPSLGSRPASPAPSSLSPSPTLRPPSPRLTGGPYARQNYATWSHSSLNSSRPRSHHSDKAFTKHSSLSSVAIYVEAAESSTDGIDTQHFDAPDTADLTHDTAGQPANDIPCFRLSLSAPNLLEEKKYTPPRLPRDSPPVMSDIEPLELDFSDERALPSGWLKYTAPEGNPYFYHPDQHVLTIANLHDEAQLTRLEEAMLNFNRIKSSSQFELPDDADLVLDLDEKDVGYYLVSCNNKAVFWLERCPQYLVTRNERLTTSKSHLGHRIRTEFWYISEECITAYWSSLENSYVAHRRHVSTFPNVYADKQRFLQDSVQELKAIVCFGYADVVSSITSTFPYDPDTLRHVLQMADKIEIDDPWSTYYMNSVARYMMLLNDERFLHFYGEPWARMSREESIHEGRQAQSIIFRFWSLLLFGLPSLYLQELHKVYVDKTVHYHSWRRFISGLKQDWENSITPATVLLSANVGFLAIQSIDNLEGNARSLAQIASYASALFSLFDYIVVQVLMLRHRQHIFDTAARGLQFINGRADMVGLEWLALTMSLPGALFNWSMITFLLALEFIFYHHSTLSTIVTLSVIVLILGFAMLLLLFGKVLVHGSSLHTFVTKLASSSFFKNQAEEGRWFFRRRSVPAEDDIPV